LSTWSNVVGSGPAESEPRVLATLPQVSWARAALSLLLIPSTSPWARAVICCACSGLAGTKPASGGGPLLVGGRGTEGRGRVGRLAVGRVVLADGLGFVVMVVVVVVVVVVVGLVVVLGAASSSWGRVPPCCHLADRR